MEYQICRSNHSNPETCVKEIAAKFSKPKIILYFSPVEHFKEYSECFHQQFPDSICMGTTALISIDKSGAQKKGLMAIGIESGIQCSAGVLEEIDTYPIKYAKRVKECVDRLGRKQNTMCLEFTAAFCCAEESVLASLNSVLDEYDIPLVGGTAGDDTSGEITYVGLNGKVYDKGCVFALLHNEGGKIHFFRENIYKPVNGNVVTATKVDYTTRTVLEYDHQPAAAVYAKQLGIAESAIETQFDTHPMGRILGSNMYITANAAKGKDKSISYFARIYENSQLVALEPDDYRRVAADTMEKIRNEVPKPSFAIMCHCLARTLLYDSEGYLQEYVKTMGSVLGDYVGFSGYGEQMNHQQFNQTMIVAVFE